MVWRRKTVEVDFGGEILENTEGKKGLTAFKLLFSVLYLRSALEMGNWVKVMQILCIEGGKMST